MNKYLVRVVKTLAYTCEAEAPDRSEAMKIAIMKVNNGIAGVPDSDVDAGVIKQIDGPWVTGFNEGLCDPDDYMNRGEPRTLLVFQRAYGNAFTSDECAVLVARAQKVTGVSVASVWNGTGCSGFSVRMKDPFTKLTKEQVAELLAPIEVGQ